ncbi:MAG TPA: hypothetical protein VF867_19930 [Arthrobacter sp.]
MTSTQPRIQSGRFTTFGHSAPTIALPAHRYPSEMPFQRTEPYSRPNWLHRNPVKLLSRRHETPVRNAMAARGVTDLGDTKSDMRAVADSISAIQGRLQQGR